MLNRLTWILELGLESYCAQFKPFALGLLSVVAVLFIFALREDFFFVGKTIFRPFFFCSFFKPCYVLRFFPESLLFLVLFFFFVHDNHDRFLNSLMFVYCSECQSDCLAFSLTLILSCLDFTNWIQILQFYSNLCVFSGCC